MTQEPAVQAALESIADTLGAVGRMGRLQYKIAALEVMSKDGGDPWFKQFWHCVHDLLEALDDEETQPQQGKELK